MAEPTAAGPVTRHITVRQAAFIGVAAMVGAGIFSLLVPPARWPARRCGWPSSSRASSRCCRGTPSRSSGPGIHRPEDSSYVRGGFGNGHLTGITAWLVYSANTIVTAMVAVSFGSYASAIFTNDNKAWAKVFAVLVLLVMTVLNVIGSQVVART